MEDGVLLLDAELPAASGGKRPQPEAEHPLSIAPRAHTTYHRRNYKRRAVARSTTAARTSSRVVNSSLARSLVPVMRPETISQLLLDMCDKFPNVSESVLSAVQKEPACRRVGIRNLPYNVPAREVCVALETAFGPVEHVSLLPRGNGLAVFTQMSAAVAAALSPDDAEQPAPVTVRGRQLAFRLLPPSDPLWEGLEAVDSWPVGSTPPDDYVTTRVSTRPRHRTRRRRTEVVVRDLAPQTTEECLASAFAHFGDVKRVVVPVDSRGHAKGHGYITFARAEDAWRAAQQTQRMINDRLTYVSMCRSIYPSG